MTDSHRVDITETGMQNIEHPEAEAEGCEFEDYLSTNFGPPYFLSLGHWKFTQGESGWLGSRQEESEE